ncbi:MAG: hypothetical protein CVU92_10285 [Firmicutes bacterium HGW-Firmicutes-17]|nr:MAG: hypothetical protein CVU92_10285 [Firmicutes bacterium HGW-Firmicutes-17]
MKKQVSNRARINNRLGEVYDYPLTIVEAPMGYGKTTAIRNFQEMEKIKPIWITFQPENSSTDYKWNKVGARVLFTRFRYFLKTCLPTG